MSNGKETGRGERGFGTRALKEDTGGVVEKCRGVSGKRGKQEGAKVCVSLCLHQSERQDREVQMCVCLRVCTYVCVDVHGSAEGGAKASESE